MARWGDKTHIDGVNVWVCDETPPKIKRYSDDGTAILEFASINFFFQSFEDLIGWADQMQNMIMDQMSLIGLETLTEEE